MQSQLWEPDYRAMGENLEGRGMRPVRGPLREGCPPGSLGGCPGWPEARAGHAPRPGAWIAAPAPTGHFYRSKGVEDLRKFDQERRGKTGSDVT
jgi:hypothetical protein